MKQKMKGSHAADGNHLFETVIGLEIHAELNTKSKIFCSCSTRFGSRPNENTCPVCMGLPGTLPVLNEEAVRLAARAGIALHCSVNRVSRFDRKNYFYPDLPKAYQITQYDLPLCESGYLDIETGQDRPNGKRRIHRIGISRIHLEEDAGKLIHPEGEPVTLLDYNRAGVPLIEIVTEPDMRSPEEAAAFLKALKSILEYTEVSDCRMEQGSLRCDVNLSVREMGKTDFGTKVEIKNLNSFREIQRALAAEAERQREQYCSGGPDSILPETRRWDNGRGRTVSMRTKEGNQDYRYFPDPDLPPVFLDRSLLCLIRNGIPELPEQKKERFLREYGLNPYEAGLLTGEKALADYYEEVVGFGVDSREAAHWILDELPRIRKDAENGEIPVKSHYLADLIQKIGEGRISRNTGKDVLMEMAVTRKTPGEIIREKGLSQISDPAELQKIIRDVLSRNADAVQDYKKGSAKAIGFLMGQVMKASRGKANPNLARSLLEELLS